MVSITVIDIGTAGSDAYVFIFLPYDFISSAAEALHVQEGKAPRSSQASGKSTILQQSRVVRVAWGVSLAMPRAMVACVADST